MTFAELHAKIQQGVRLHLQLQEDDAWWALADALHEIVSRLERLEHVLGLPEWPLKVAKDSVTVPGGRDGVIDDNHGGPPIKPCTDEHCPTLDGLPHFMRALPHFHDEKAPVTGGVFGIKASVVVPGQPLCKRCLAPIPCACHIAEAMRE